MKKFTEFSLGKDTYGMVIGKDECLTISTRGRNPITHLVVKESIPKKAVPLTDITSGRMPQDIALAFSAVRVSRQKKSIRK